MAAGRSNGAIAASLFLTKRAVEKHINAIFLKLGLREYEDTSRRVTAALIYLADSGSTGFADRVLSRHRRGDGAQQPHRNLARRRSHPVRLMRLPSDLLDTGLTSSIAVQAPKGDPWPL